MNFTWAKIPQTGIRIRNYWSVAIGMNPFTQSPYISIEKLYGGVIKIVKLIIVVIHLKTTRHKTLTIHSFIERELPHEAPSSIRILFSRNAPAINFPTFHSLKLSSLFVLSWEILPKNSLLFWSVSFPDNSESVGGGHVGWEKVRRPGGVDDDDDSDESLFHILSNPRNNNTTIAHYPEVYKRD